MSVARLWLCGLALALCAAALAMTDGEYQALRARTTVAATGGAQLGADLSGLAGRVIEVQGAINGTFSSGEGMGFLLRVTPQQILILQSRTADRDIAIGAFVRALAQVPAQGSVLECLAVTPAPEAATAITMAPPEEVLTESRPPVIYYKSPAPKVVEPRVSVFSEARGLAQNPEVVRLYSERIQSYNRRLEPATAEKIAFHIIDKSERYGLDPRLLMALVARESRFNPRAVSPAGAMGLGQLMPGTAAGLGVRDAFDIEQNLDGAARYISAQLQSFGRLSLALAAYNAGPGAVRRYDGIPPYRETQNYVRLVWETYADLAGFDPETGEKIAAR